MNIYFLLEDSKSACGVWPNWLKIMLPDFKQVNLLTELKDNQYCVESGYGYPAIERVFKESLQLISDEGIKVNHFVLVYDSDDKNIEELENKKSEYVKLFKSFKIDTEFHVLVIRKCFETWLMGNRDVYPYNNEKFQEYENFFNASLNNPEDMWCPSNVKMSVSRYHCRYFQEMLRNSIKKNYSKGSYRYVMTEEFFAGLINRINESDDIKTFKEFISIVSGLKCS